MRNPHTEDDPRQEKDPREKRTDLSVSLGSELENAQSLLREVARTEEGHELRAAVQQETRGKIDYSARAGVGYDVTADEPIPEPYHRRDGIAELRRPGQTLAAQEREYGEQREKKRHEKRAFDAYIHGEAREKMARRTNVEMARQDRQDWTERAQLANGRYHDDPQAELSQDELAGVNQTAANVADEYPHARRAWVAKELAHRMVERDNSPFAALVGLCNDLDESPSTLRSLDSLDAYEDDHVRVRATVSCLFDPAARSQYQVAILDGGETTIKFTVWQSSKWASELGIPDLSVGDEIEIVGARVNAYKGQPTLAADRDTHVHILEHGDGETVTNHSDASAARDRVRRAPWDFDARQHAWANHLDSVTPRLPTAARSTTDTDRDTSCQTMLTSWGPLSDGHQPDDRDTESLTTITQHL